MLTKKNLHGTVVILFLPSDVNKTALNFYILEQTYYAAILMLKLLFYYKNGLKNGTITLVNFRIISSCNQACRMMSYKTT